jgi:hypothetical protein
VNANESFARMVRQAQRYLVVVLLACHLVAPLSSLLLFLLYQQENKLKLQSLEIISAAPRLDTSQDAGAQKYIAYLGTEKGGVTPSVCRSTSVSHTTRNLRHECRRFSIIDQCLSVTPPGICGTFAAEYFSICQLFVI